MPGPGDDIAQGVTQGLTQFNPVTKMMGMAQQGGQGILELLQQLGLLQSPGQAPMPPMPGPAQAGAAPMPPQGLKGRMTGNVEPMMPIPQERDDYIRRQLGLPGGPPLKTR